jgi:hypothetical protein
MLVRRMYFAGSMLLLPLGAGSAAAQTVVVAPTQVPAQSPVYVAPTALA